MFFIRYRSAAILLLLSITFGMAFDGSAAQLQPPLSSTHNSVEKLQTTTSTTVESTVVKTPTTYGKTSDLSLGSPSPQLQMLPTVNSGKHASTKEQEPLEPPPPSITEQALQAVMTSETKSRPQPFQSQPLQQFGYSFFRADSSEFSSLTDIPVSQSYILGAGDRLNISMWGSIEGAFDLEINRTGEITLPRVGTIKLSGVEFGRAQAVISGQLSRIYRDFGLNVTMGKLRLIKVYLVGEVLKPGDYNLTSLSTVINALASAGGPTKNGSLRKISLRRDGKVVETIDLYDFFLKGDKSKDIRLQSGDTIFVPSIGPVAGIAGNVKRPAIYELNTECSLKDLLALADGLIPTGYLQRLQISRIEAHDKKVVTDINIDPKDTGGAIDALTARIPVRDMDLVKIFPIDGALRDYVRLEGYVLRPGDYALKPGMRMADLLPKENLLPEYYAKAGQLTRLMPPDYHPEVLHFNLDGALANTPADNIALQEFDTIRIFSRWDMEEMPMVRVSGEIQKPGAYRLMKNMRIRDLILTAGNPLLTAYIDDAEITRLEKTASSVRSFPLTINLHKAMADDPEHNILLEPFDELFIRKIPNWAETAERYVTLRGEVRYPGVYPVFKGERLSSLLKRAGGFTDKAYLRGGKFLRRSVQEQQQKRMEQVIERTEQEILRKQSALSSTAASKEELESTKATLESLLKGIEKMKTIKAEGRVVLRLSQEKSFEQSPYNIELEGGDLLDIPMRPAVVSVLGQVYNPTSFVWQPEATDVDTYLHKSGGGTSDADQSEMYILKADGSVYSRQQSSFGLHWSDEGERWRFGGFLSAPLEPGDTLVVPQKIERIAWMREIKDITQILANMALTAGTVWLWFK